MWWENGTSSPLYVAVNKRTPSRSLSSRSLSSRTQQTKPTAKAPKQLRTTMAAELSFAPLLSTCTQHRRLLQSRRSTLFHCPTLPLPLSPSLSTSSSSSSSTPTTRGKVLCQTAGTHLFDAKCAAEAGQNRLLKVLSLSQCLQFYPSLFFSRACRNIFASWMLILNLRNCLLNVKMCSSNSSVSICFN